MASSDTPESAKACCGLNIIDGHLEDVALINRDWYIIHWHLKEACYYVSPSYNYIISPSSIGLGTLDEPYQTPELEKEDSSDSQVSVASLLQYREPEPIASESE